MFKNFKNLLFRVFTEKLFGKNPTSKIDLNLSQFPYVASLIMPSSLMWEINYRFPQSISRKVIGRHVFATSAPVQWNRLPLSVRPQQIISSYFKPTQDLHLMPGTHTTIVILPWWALTGLRLYSVLGMSLFAFQHIRGSSSILHCTNGSIIMIVANLALYLLSQMMLLSRVSKSLFKPEKLCTGM